MPTPPRETLPAGTQIGRTALCVRDLDRIVEFYRTVLGFSVVSRDESTAQLGVGQTPLLVLRTDENARESEPSEAGLFHNAFRVPTRAALADALVRVRTHSQLSGASDHLTSEAIYLSDPEGNGIEIYRDRPRRSWPFDKDGLPTFGSEPLNLDDLMQVGTIDSTLPSKTDVGHVHLEVTDVENALEFYGDVLGFEVKERRSGVIFLAAGDYHHHLGANTWNGRREPASGNGLAWFEIVVPDRNAYEGVRERTVEHGLSVTEFENHIAVTDPDGIEIRICTEETGPLRCEQPE